MHISWFQAACAAIMTMALAAATPAQHHHIARRSFAKLQCKGVFDAAMFTRLDKVCDDCYQLFQESQVFSLCRCGCFNNNYFKGCIDALYLQEEEETFKSYIRRLHGGECFTSEYFKGCVEVLQEEDNLELFKSYIRRLHGADPRIVL